MRAYWDGLAFAYLAAEEFGLDPYEARVLSVIMAHWNTVKRQSWPSQATIIEVTRVGHAKVSRCINALRDHGLLVVKDRGPRANLYESPAFEQWLRLGKPTVESSLSEITFTASVREVSSPTEITVISDGDDKSSPRETGNSVERTQAKNSDPSPSEKSGAERRKAPSGLFRSYRVNEGLARLFRDRVEDMTGSTAGVNIRGLATELAKFPGHREVYVSAMGEFFTLYPDQVQAGHAWKYFMSILPRLLQNARLEPSAAKPSRRLKTAEEVQEIRARYAEVELG